MKRASLALAPAPPNAASADLTDRLLAQKPSSTQRAVSKARAKRKPKLEPAESTSASVPSKASSGVSVDSAIAQSRAAVEALRAAAGEAPARYNVALRYRLDALAHHLNQITEFVETLRD